MQCPVCLTHDLEDSAKSCPKCHSDLSAFKIIGSIEQQNKKQRQWNRLLFFLVIVIAAGWLVSGIYLKKTGTVVIKGNENDTETEQKLNTLKNKNQLLEDSLAAIKAQLENLEKAKKIEIEKVKKEVESNIDEANEAGNDKTEIHIVEKGETLSKIAKAYYGDPMKFDVIARENNIEDPNLIIVGMKLKISKNEN